MLWTAGTAFAAFREQERPQLFFLMMLLGETATLGAFLAQDLLLFVLFFDLMLVPFYFLFGVWGSDREGGPSAPAATLKMIVYTLVGSLLMLVAAIATAVIAADGGKITFSIAELAQHPLGEGSQRWIFWFFAAAFLVKMPAFLLHGWMPDAYRAAPLPALAVFSGVLAKVGAYGFLRVVLPLFPDAAVEFQEVILVIALASILYGSVMAFTQTNVRLVAGYSSVAQLGFITAGIFALSADGADGAVLQMVNHGLVVAPLFVIVAILAERSGTEDLREMGGMAIRAPVLAALFLIVTLATLAMPGSANFIGEFYILNGLFDSKIVFAFVADLRRRDVRLLRAAPLPADDAQPPARRASSRARSACRRRGPRPPRPLHPRPRPLPAADPEADRCFGPGKRRAVTAKPSGGADSEARTVDRLWARDEVAVDELPRPEHRLRGDLAGDRADRGGLRRPADRRLPAAEADGAAADAVVAWRDGRAADLAVERTDRPGLRGAAPRRPGDRDLADRDPARPSSPSSSRSASPPSSRRARASTTRCCSARCWG